MNSNSNWEGPLKKPYFQSPWAQKKWDYQSLVGSQNMRGGDIEGVVLLSVCVAGGALQGENVSTPREAGGSRALSSAAMR